MIDGPNKTLFRSFIFPALVMAAATVAIYWPALTGEFVWDDALLIQKNPIVTGELNWRTVWFHTDFPLSITVFWWEWHAWGSNPAGYHCVNAAFHLIGCLTLWRLLLFLRVPGAFVAAFLFLAHPVAVASVAWVSELKNTLSLPLFLGAIWCFMRWEELPERYRDYFLALIFFVLALLAKTSTVTLPAILLLLIWWKRGKLGRIHCLALIPFFLFAAGFGVMTIWFQSHQAYEAGAIAPATMATRLARAGLGIWFYLAKAIFPWRLNLVYPQWNFAHWVMIGLVALGLVLVTIFVLARYRGQWGKSPLVAFVYFILMLLPVLGLVDMWFLTIAPVSDHFQYLALIGPLVLIVGLARTFLKPMCFYIAVPLVLCGLAFQSHRRARTFHDDETLWRQTLAKNPLAWPGHNNLGCILAEQGNLSEATIHFRQALKIFPQNAAAHINLGRALALQNQSNEAMAEFATAAKLKPNDADTHAQFASFLMDAGAQEKALAEQQEALRLKPNVNARLDLARMQQESGRARDAIAGYREVLRVRPDQVDALSRLAWILSTSPDNSLRNGVEALAFAAKACQLTGQRDPLPLGTLAAAYAENGRFSEAVESCTQAIAAAEKKGDENFIKANRALLKLYQARNPYRESYAP
jgi:tetratricopeptide (TPR) repeat protein